MAFTFKDTENDVICFKPSENGALRDHRPHLAVTRACDDDVATGERRAPQSDARLVDLGAGACTGDRGRPVLVLEADVDQLPRLTLAVAEVPVVEHKRGAAGLDKALGVGGKPVRARTREPVRHHDARRRGVDVGGEIQPRGARLPA